MRLPDAARAAGLFALLATAPAPAPAEEPSATRDDFRQTAIPEGVAARFTCHQAGAEIVALENVATFAPARVQGIMTFSLNTRDGRTHLVYLTGEAACRLEVRARR